MVLNSNCPLWNRDLKSIFSFIFNFKPSVDPFKELFCCHHLSAWSHFCSKFLRFFQIKCLYVSPISKCPELLSFKHQSIVFSVISVEIFLKSFLNLNKDQSNQLKFGDLRKISVRDIFIQLGLFVGLIEIIPFFFRSIFHQSTAIKDVWCT